MKIFVGFQVIGSFGVFRCDDELALEVRTNLEVQLRVALLKGNDGSIAGKANRWHNSEFRQSCRQFYSFGGGGGGQG